MKNSLPSALVLGFVSLAWGDESLRAQPVRSPTELPPASEPPPPQPAEAPWSFAALHPKAFPKRATDLGSADARLADKLNEFEQLQREIEYLERHFARDGERDQRR
jgi:hypothetical protein